MSDPVVAIKQKCAQYQNATGLGDAEVHAVVGFILRNAEEAAERFNRVYERACNAEGERDLLQQQIKDMGFLTSTKGA